VVGTIKRLIWDRGFGFIEGARQSEWFFHRSGYRVPFDDLREGVCVSFDEEASTKGPRATNIQIWHEHARTCA
jgi:CspA family cold shock protein